MIWGRTPEQIRADQAALREHKHHQWAEYERRWAEPRPWFAWWPIKLDDGRRAWLEKVWVRGYVNWWGDWTWSYTPTRPPRFTEPQPDRAAASG